jgi:hypothetical protein
MRRPVILFIFFALTALAFLVYTVFNLEKLNITLIHPRVLVEFGLFVIFFLTAVYLHLK